MIYSPSTATATATHIWPLSSKETLAITLTPLTQGKTVREKPKTEALAYTVQVANGCKYELKEGYKSHMRLNIHTPHPRPFSLAGPEPVFDKT